MPANEHCLRVPNGQHDKVMTFNADVIYITVTQIVCWSYSDPGNCFNGNFLPAGTVQPAIYGPYRPTSEGVVTYKAIPGPCLTGGPLEPLTGHTITIGSTVEDPYGDEGKERDDERE